MATSFTIVDGQTVTTNQSLTAAGETGVIDSGGEITVSSGDAIGMYGAGAKSLTNNGTISSTGNRAIDLGAGDDSTIINNGTINGAGATSPTINLDSGVSNLSFTNTGTISSSAANEQTIRLRSDTSTLVNSGTISSTGTGSDAIEFVLTGGDNNTLDNSGTITSSGAGAIAVNFGATDGNVFTNSGTISATGAATQAIVGGTGTTTLTLESGSSIIGSIDLGGGTDTVNINTGANSSSTLTILNADTVNFLGGVAGVQSGDVVTTVDPTGQSAQGVALNTLTNAFHSVISQRMAQTKALPPTQLASLELSPDMLFQERAPIAWGEVFGSHRTRGDDGLALAYTHDYKGFTGGYEQVYKKGRLGIMAGFADAEVSTDTTSIQTETNSFFAGVYGHVHLGKVNLTASLTAGFEDHDNERTVTDNLAGTETARSDFTSVFFSPSVTLSSAYTFKEHFELRPSATLTYNVARYDDYTETGTTRSNLSIDDRTAQTLNGRIQLAVAMALNETSEFELRSGFTTRHTFDGDTNASLSGASFQYSSAGDDSVQGGFVGGNLRFNATDRLGVVADVEYREASGDESEIAARFRLEYRF
jgi:uncharacterized protein YhjY with autotransporter beta-barrel domain